MPDLQQLEYKLAELADPAIAVHSTRFFKTGPGEYGEGDQFLGIRVPVLRKLVRQFRDIAMEDVRELLHSAFHEKRLLAALMLVDRFQRGSETDQQLIYDLYHLHIPASINNWDIIDTTCPHIMGAWLYERDRLILYTMAASNNLWQRRAAMMACFYFIRHNDFADGLKIAEIVLVDKEDLIHKAAGWMLREIGKREREVEERFLEKHCRTMPRTMLRYAIEHFEQEKRKYYMEAATRRRKKLWPP
jgi:3-methyladenine DNA glycosylase AlkD